MYKTLQTFRRYYNNFTVQKMLRALILYVTRLLVSTVLANYYFLFIYIIILIVSLIEFC